MPITPSAIKRLRQNKVRNLRNRAARANLRSTIKKVRSAIEGKDQALAKSALAAAISVIDKAAGKGIIHKNMASRNKSRLSRQINAL
jgi:small subunit ribosomal protein S20